MSERMGDGWKKEGERGRKGRRSDEDEGKTGPLHRGDAPLSIFLEII